MKNALQDAAEFLILLVLFFFATSCSAELENGVFKCVDETDCPKGWSCDPVGKLCYEDPALFPNPDDSASDGDSHTSQEDTDETDMATCAKAARNDENIVCCPDDLPWGCDREDWSFSIASDPRSHGCCLPDLSGVVRCEGSYQSHLKPNSCHESVCGYDEDLERLGCPRNDENSCFDPIVIDSFPFNWVGYWPHYGQSFAPTNNCGSGGVDIWFEVDASGGMELVIKETTPSEVVIRQPEDCDSGVCRDWSDNGSLTVKFETGRVYIVVSEDNYNRSDALSMTFELK